MATSGNFSTNWTSGLNPNQRLTVAWVRTAYSTANMTSTLHWTLSVERNPNADKNYIHNISVVMNGVTVFSRSSISWADYSIGVIAQGDITIQHDNDGSKSFTASAQCGFYYSSINSSGSGTFTLDTILQPTTGTWNVEQVDETSIKLNYDVEDAIDLVRVVYNTGGSNTYVDIAASGTEGYVLVGSLPAGTLINIVSVVVRRADTQAYGTIPGTSSIMTYAYPYSSDIQDITIGDTVSVTLTNPLNRTCSVSLVANNVTIQTVSGNGTINFNANTQAMYQSLPQGANSAYYKVKVAYSTNESVSNNATYSIPASYHFPTVQSVSVTRCDNAGVEDPVGQYAKLVYSFTSTNTISTPVVSVYNGSTAHGTYNATVSGNNIEVIIGSSNLLDLATQYSASISVKDDIATWTNRPASIVVIIPKSVIPMSLYEDSQGNVGARFGLQAVQPGWDFVTNNGSTPLMIDGVDITTMMGGNVTATNLYNGSGTSGTFNASDYFAFVFFVKIGSTAQSRVSAYIPKEYFGTASSANNAFQCADESYYSSWSVYLTNSGATGNFNLLSRSNTNQVIQHVWGLKTGG